MKKKIGIGFTELVWYPAVNGLVSAIISQWNDPYKVDKLLIS